MVFFPSFPGSMILNATRNALKGHIHEHKQSLRLTVGEKLSLFLSLDVSLSLTHSHKQTHASISIVHLRKQICLILAVVPQPQLQPCRAFI